MWKHRILYLAALLTAIITYVVSDRRESLVFLCLLVLAPIVSIGLQLAAMDAIRLSCSVQRTCRVGQQVPIFLEVDRRNRLPLGAVRVQMQFENCLFQETAERDFYLQPAENGAMSFRYPFVSQDCGAVRICAVRMDCLDLFGLFAWHKPVEFMEEIMVYPPDLHLYAHISRQPKAQNMGDIYDPYRRGQDVSEVAGLRDYIQGDSLHSIHWKLSSKLEDLVVREFGYPSNYQILIIYDILNLWRGNQISSRCNNAVLAITVALSYSMMRMNLEHNVGRIHLGEIRTVPVSSLSTHEEMVMNLLSMPIMEEPGEDVVYLFLRGNLRSQYTKIIYITPAYEEKTVKRLSEEVDLTLIHVYEGEPVGYLSAGDLTVIPVDAASYQETLERIDI